MNFEEKLLEKLFGLQGELLTCGESEFDFDIMDGGTVAIIRLQGNKALLYTQKPKWEAEYEAAKELTNEEVVELKNIGYKW